MGGRGGGMVERIIDHCILCGYVIKLTLSICQCQPHSGPKKCLPMSCISALSLLVVVVEWVGTDIALSCYIAIPASLLSITLLHNTLQFLTFTTVNTTFPEIARLANIDQCPVQKQQILCTNVHYLVTCGAFQGSCMFLPIKV